MGAFALASCSGGESHGSSAGPADSSPGDASEAAAIVPGLSCAAGNDGGLTVAFNPMYSGFIADGMHTFQVPALVTGSNANVTWSFDTSMVAGQKDPERPNQILLTVLDAGTTTVVAQSDDGKCGSSPLTVTAAQESDWMIGNARYNDGTSLHLNAAAATNKDASPFEQGGNYQPACTNCHGETATKSEFMNVSHTPEQTGGFSDAELLDIILHGDFPPRLMNYFDTSIVQYAAWHGFHQWIDIQPDEYKGIIVYLRSLTPEPQYGELNLGALQIFSDAGAADVGAAGAADAESGTGTEAATVEAASEAAAEASPEATAEPGPEASVEPSPEAAVESNPEAATESGAGGD